MKRNFFTSIASLTLVLFQTGSVSASHSIYLAENLEKQDGTTPPINYVFWWWANPTSDGYWWADSATKY